MLTLKDAAQLGWTLELLDTPEQARAYKGDPVARHAADELIETSRIDLERFAADPLQGGTLTREEAGIRFAQLSRAHDDARRAVYGFGELHVGSTIPLFSLLRLISIAEGVPFATADGGTEAITPALVHAATGETYAEPE